MTLWSPGSKWSSPIYHTRICLIFLLITIQSSLLESTEGVGVIGFPSTISLGKLNVHTDAVTISGFSAGASMSVQFHVAHSSLFHGVAIFSQAFYRCGPNSLVEFGLRCSKIGLGIFPYDVQRSINDVIRYETRGLVDSLQNLRNQRIFIWTGSLDEYVPPEMAVQNADFYKRFSSNPAELIKLTLFHAKHLFPTTNFGDGCDQDAALNEYLGNCNYSGAYNALEFLLRDKTTFVTPLTYDLNPTSLNANLKAYNQSEFYPGGNITEVAMGELGFIYIPTRCQGSNASKCFLHINFHGCNEWPPEVALRYIQHSGFIPVANANDIIIVFPLSTKVPENMGGCWDFFSFTRKNFATNQGSQVKVARAIVQRILNGN